MFNLTELVNQAESIAIAGHVRPDGDCIGSCLAMYNYLQENLNKEQKKKIDIYLEEFPEEFHFLMNTDQVKHEAVNDVVYDLFLSIDCGSIDRLGVCGDLFTKAKKKINIDHHISNTRFGDINHVVPDASSSAEVIFELLDENQISKAIAECLYIGIIHDTGVFKHSNTSEKTMQIAGKLIRFGAMPSKLIDETFYQKTHLQNQILGRCLMESILVLDGKIIISSITKKIADFYNIKPSDTDGIIDQLRVTKGVEVAIFLREDAPCEFKVSLRSNGVVDVSKIAVFFGGGGHVKAAGCSMKGSLHDVINNITIGIEDQLNKRQHA